MKIVLLSTFDEGGGAPLAACRLQKGLRLLGQDSRMLVKVRSGRDPRVVPVRARRAESRERGDALAFMQWQFVDQNRTEVSNTRFSLPYPGYDLSRTRLVRSAEVVNLHWVSLFQSIETIAALLESGRAVVWTLHDQNPFTGGCHYSAGCRGYAADCRGCPQLREDPWQLPAQVVAAKTRLWRRNLTLVAPSGWMADCARQSSALGRFRVEVIPNSLETDVFRPRDRVEAKRALGIEPDRFVLLVNAYTNREKRKGLDLLLQALRFCLGQPRFRELAANGRIQVLNLGPSGAELQSAGLAVRDVGIVRSSEKVAAVHAAADVLVMPSLEENLANVMLEALACGTPVLGFAVGGTPEVVRHGVNGLLAPACAAEALGENLVQLVLDRELRERMGRNGRTLIESRFKLSDQAGRYLELFRELTRPGAASAAVSRPVLDLRQDPAESYLGPLYQLARSRFRRRPLWRRYRDRLMRALPAMAVLRRRRRLVRMVQVAFRQVSRRLTWARRRLARRLSWR